MLKHSAMSPNVESGDGGWNMLKQWDVSAGVLISYGLFGMSQVACSVLLISLACLSSRAHSKSPSVLKHSATSPNVDPATAGGIC